LLLRTRNPRAALQYQIFIEPKGKHLLKQDPWSEDFLKPLKEEPLLKPIAEDYKHVVWGMPFYNEESRRAEFETAFKELPTD